jgi:hypothetical protein
VKQPGTLLLPWLIGAEVIRYIDQWFSTGRCKSWLSGYTSGWTLTNVSIYKGPLVIPTYGQIWKPSFQMMVLLCTFLKVHSSQQPIVLSTFYGKHQHRWLIVMGKLDIGPGVWQGGVLSLGAAMHLTRHGHQAETLHKHSPQADLPPISSSSWCLVFLHCTQQLFKKCHSLEMDWQRQSSCGCPFSPGVFLLGVSGLSSWDMQNRLPVSSFPQLSLFGC